LIPDSDSVNEILNTTVWLGITELFKGEINVKPGGIMSFKTVIEETEEIDEVILEEVEEDVFGGPLGAAIGPGLGGRFWVLWILLLLAILIGAYVIFRRRHERVEFP